MLAISIAVFELLDCKRVLLFVLDCYRALCIVALLLCVEQFGKLDGHKRCIEDV